MKLEDIKDESQIQSYVDDIQNLTLKEIVIDLSTLVLLKLRYEKIIYELEGKINGLK